MPAGFHPPIHTDSSGHPSAQPTWQDLDFAVTTMPSFGGNQPTDRACIEVSIRRGGGTGSAGGRPGLQGRADGCTGWPGGLQPVRGSAGFGGQCVDDVAEAAAAARRALSCR